MKLDVSNVFENPGMVFEKKLSGPIGSVKFQGQEFEFNNGADVTLSYFGDEEDGITVTGGFEAETTAACDRCLKEFKYTVEFSFTEYYKESPDDTQYKYSGETIELGDMLTDNIILNLPTKLLCEQDCKGLCPKCGANLNEGQCGCESEPDESNPFYGLKDLIDD